MNFYLKKSMVLWVFGFGILGSFATAQAADFITFPHPLHLSKKLPATVSTEDVVPADENTIRLISTKIKPTLLNSAKAELENLTFRVDPSYAGTANEFERAAKVKNVTAMLRKESEAIDLNKTYLFESQASLETMSPDKLCITAPSNPKFSFSFDGVYWPVSKYLFFSAEKRGFDFYCAKNVDEAQKFEERMSATDFRRVSVQIYARPLPAIFYADGSSHIYFVPYVLKVMNPKNQSVLFEVKR